MLNQMRLHILLDDDLVAEIDRRAGERKRSDFIARIVRDAIDDENRWDEIEAGLGTLTDAGHEWDVDAANWVRAQRQDTSRSG
jgi:metal-responsive CopG/Arc/MetJ family transcriptional regulator